MVTLHDPESVGFSTTRLSRIRPAMQSYVDDNNYPGLITLIARHGRVVHHECFGLMNIETHQPMRPDAICTLASMTKPITSVAALMLFEQGRFQLNDPIEKFLPAAKDLKVCGQTSDTEFQRVDLARPPTLRDLFTHTAGFTFGVPEGHPLAERFAAFHSLNPTTLQDYVQNLMALPLWHQPAAQWHYGLSMEVLAHIVEVIADMPFDEFVRHNICEPLGMADTGYVVPDHKVDRLASIYAPTDQGGHQRVGPDPAEYRMPHGGWGLYSTVTDYARFVQMLLNRGQLDGARLLGRKTVDLMLTNHLPPSVMPSFDVVDLSKGYYTKGYGMGLGMRVMMNPAENEILGSVGNFSWSGSTNTYFWGDPKENLIGIIWAQSEQRMYRYPLERQFMTLAYQALVD